MRERYGFAGRTCAGVVAARSRRGGAGATATAARFLAELETRLQGAVRADRRGHARRRALEHDRRADLQPLRSQGRRLHGRRRVRRLAARRRARRALRSRPATSTSRSRAASISASTRSSSSASRRRARWRPRRCGSTTRRSQGFWPGEGCGFVVLPRLEDALARRASRSSPSCGAGASRPTAPAASRGPRSRARSLALRRAYARAPASGSRRSSYFEGHGTGTRVGDATELAALSLAPPRGRRAARRRRSARSRRTSVTRRPPPASRA